MHLATSIDIAAPPSRVWAILLDFERHPSWNPFIRTISGEPRVGERLHVVLGPPGAKPMTFKPTVTQAEPERGFAWTGTLGAKWLFSGEHTFRLEPLPSGGTRFHHSEAFGGVLLPLLRKSLDTDTRRGFEAMNDALKTEAERAA